VIGRCIVSAFIWRGSTWNFR